MNKNEYKEKHIPHRVNLLITYRERFRNLSDVSRQNVRDFHRCSKDISMLMVRFFLYELGIGLGERHIDISERKHGEFTKRLAVRDVIKDPLYLDILEVLRAANRAVAHLEPNDVNHNFTTHLDDQRLFDVITYVENKIITNIYESRGEFETVMSEKDNDMNRERLKL